MVKRDIRDYLNDILTHIDLACSFVEGMTFEEFENDDKTMLALTRALEIIGEATKQIPLTIRQQYPRILWKDIAGMRDKIAHVYFGISLEVVWSTIHEDLPKLRPVIQAILDKIQASEEIF
ncbi:DUF86 domain-containing protein [cf. Phormidesmis sp. LEGE 11477]|uniref:HepT-like ribonuclease domain-containing protein n=1 Tax=cf. Phormidesmis sp. LEGE 11477 TaxID=1828680 RepID=UPI001881D681|nr:DUF86 domain-containing protein [cf. Phormidesmis sp. LEGE 11477]MBE9063807.1 DUF86 domain-containing protein [cf. Phormidesmis sp. LEGE 11477]